MKTENKLEADKPTDTTNFLPSDAAPCSASVLFSEDEIKLLRQAGSIGDMDAARIIVESKGLTWMDSLVEKTQIQQHNV